jgi:hypothetical protein
MILVNARACLYTPGAAARMWLVSLGTFARKGWYNLQDQDL